MTLTTYSSTVPNFDNNVAIQRMASTEFEGWKIKNNEQTCGHVKFHPKMDDIFKNHVSVDIKVSEPFRGLHIGRTALKMAIEASQHRLFVAHLSKSNIASERALSAVGFKKFNGYGGRQLCMVFNKE